jgi:hypothetical protein
VFTYPEGFLVSYSTNFGNGSGSVHKIYGDQGTMDLTNWGAPTYSGAGAIKPTELTGEEKPVPAVDTPDHFLDWLQCLRSGGQCNAPIEAGFNHCVPALMAMRAFDTGVRQVYDAEKREFRDG